MTTIADVLAVLAGEALAPDRAASVRALLLEAPLPGDEAAAVQWQEFVRQAAGALESRPWTALAEQLVHGSGTATEGPGDPSAEAPALDPENVKNEYFSRLLDHARELYPAEELAAERTGAASLVSTVFLSFFQGQTCTRSPQWQAKNDLWSLLLAIAQARMTQRHQAVPSAASFHPVPEPSREFAEVFGQSCQELLEKDPASDLEKRITILTLQRYTEHEIAQDLAVLEDEVLNIVGHVRSRLQVRLDDLQQAG